MSIPVHFSFLAMEHERVTFLDCNSEDLPAGKMVFKPWERRLPTLFQETPQSMSGRKQAAELILIYLLF